MLTILARADGSPLPITQAVLTIIACSAVAGLWAVFRPDLVRDNEGRRLPSSVTARLTFTILFIFGYLAMAAAFLFGGFFIKSVTHLVGVVPKFLEEFDNQAFVLALFATFGLYSFPPFREIERSVLSWMHDTRHLRSDLKALSEHLGQCPYNVSAEEQSRNLKDLESLEVYITDNDTRGINLESVIAWRKTASLLRHVREWNAAEPRVLSQEDMDRLSEFEGAHARKTRLAADIIRMLDSMRESGNASGALSAVSDMLARASHGNRTGVAQLEAAAQAKLGNESEPVRERPVRITSGQLQEYMKKIEGYFLVEYRLLLDRVAKLAAKSIVHAGDLADNRLDELKAVGFTGLGTIRPLSAHRILWLFMSVAVGGFLIYYVLWYDNVLQRLRNLPGKSLSAEQIDGLGQTMLIGIFFFVTTIAFAALIGALFGSSSSNSRAKETPWGRYFFAGLIAVVVFFALQLIREAVVHATGLSDMLALIQASSWDSRLRQSAAWSVLPLFITISICWLARQRPWQPPSFLGESTTAILQRLIDGIVVGLLMLPSFAISIAILQMSGFNLPIVLNSRFDPPVMAILGILGFFVGAVVVRDVRSAAHAQVIAPNTQAAEDKQQQLNAVAKPAL
jgi:hypothetical protein